MTNDRRGEWFVPRFGPERFRIAVGLLFWPYTGMVLSFVLIGGLLARTIHWDRMGWIVIAYLLGLGVAAHALDALGRGGVKPWGAIFSDRALWIAGVASLVPAVGIGLGLALFAAPWLGALIIVETFFLLAYNLEWSSGRFHTDGWFVLSWGMLPVWAGYVAQTNRLSLSVILVSGAAGVVSWLEIRASRPYKTLRRSSTRSEADEREMMRLERRLKTITLTTIGFGFGFLIVRLAL